MYQKILQKIARRKIIFTEPFVTVNTTIYFRKGVCTKHDKQTYQQTLPKKQKHVAKLVSDVLCKKKTCFIFGKCNFWGTLPYQIILQNVPTNATKNITCAHEYLDIIVGLAHEGSLKRGVEILPSMKSPLDLLMCWDYILLLIHMFDQ